MSRLSGVTLKSLETSGELQYDWSQVFETRIQILDSCSDWRRYYDSEITVISQTAEEIYIK
jgi:hypothetical protein